MPHISYCLPIVKPSRDLVLKTITKHIHEYDYFEVWLDRIKDINDKVVQQLQDQLGDRLIAKLPGPKISLFNHSPALVDVSVAAIPKNSKLNLIISYHNYAETPSDAQFKKIIALMSIHRPKIYKIATHCRQVEDAIRLLQLLVALKSQGLKCIVIGMGELGKLTRVAGALWGNEFTFAPLVESEKTAAGQLTQPKLELILQALTR